MCKSILVTTGDTLSNNTISNNEQQSQFGQMNCLPFASPYSVLRLFAVNGNKIVRARLNSPDLYLLPVCPPTSSHSNHILLQRQLHYLYTTRARQETGKVTNDKNNKNGIN